MRAFAAFVYGLAVIAGCMVSALVIGTLGALPFIIVPRGRRERWTVRVAQAWSWFVVRVLLAARPKVTGDSGLGPREGAVVFCNHRSWLDPLLLIIHLRSNGLSKRQILWLPAIGFYGWLTGAIFLDRRSEASRARAREEVIRMVAAGHRIQVFPEGTRTRSGELRDRVYLTTARDAFEHNLPVVPCAVMDTERSLPVPMVGAFPFARVRLHVGVARYPRDHADAEAFAQACWLAVQQLVSGLEEERSPGGGEVAPVV